MRLFHSEQVGPLLVLRFPAVVDLDAVTAMMATYDRAHRRGARFAAVLDASKTRRLPGPRERKVLDEWLSDPARHARERELTVGSAIVIQSGLVRAFVRALNFVRTPITPQYWTPSLEDGVEWCCERLVAASILLGPELEQARAAAGAAQGRFAARR